jgi:hypothetical protein
MIKMVTKTLLALAAGAIMTFGAAGTSQAQSLSFDSMTQPSASLIYVADGCGPAWYRGPNGACHRFGRGPYPWGYGPSPHHWNPCYYLGRGGPRCWLN